MAYKSIHTYYGLQKMGQAEAQGTTIKLLEMAVGDGNGNPVTPDANQSNLVRERYRAIINRVYIEDPVNHPRRYTAELIVPAAIGGFTVREIGVFDAEGGLFIVGNVPDTYKPLASEGAFSDAVYRVVFEVTNEELVNLQVDPNVAVVTQSWILHNITPAFLIPGGTTGQFLIKESNADGAFKWGDLSGVNVTVDCIEEPQTLAAGQTVVDLAQTTTRGLAVYIDGVRILRGLDWTPDPIIATRLTLAHTYPAGTKFAAAQNDPTGNALTPLEQSKNLADVLNKETARENLGVFSKAETRQMAPAGAVVHFARMSAPSGWLKCNGAAVSRTAYADLFAAIGTAFGIGDGFNTFNLPDLRGEFVRSWSDGRNVDSGRAFGTSQGDAIRNITGLISGGGGTFFDKFEGAFADTGTRHATVPNSSSNNNRTDDFKFDASRVVPTASENRPRNVALLACIKF